MTMFPSVYLPIALSFVALLLYRTLSISSTIHPYHQDKNDFIKTLKEERKTLYKQKLKEFDDEVKDERVKRLGARKASRKEERRSKYIKDKEEAAQKEAEERMKREREEEKRKAEEEYEEKMRKLE